MTVPVQQGRATGLDTASAEFQDAGTVPPPPDLAISPDPATRPELAEVLRRAADVRERLAHTIAQSRALVAEARAATDRQRSGLPPDQRRRLLTDSAYARLLARLETMPTIEQAKGILMFQANCTDAEAFDMLRRASQRMNVPVREIAARIVAKTAGSSGASAPVRAR